METNLLLHKLRNAYGQNAEELREVRLAAAEEIEKYRDAYKNMCDFAVSKGLDITTTGKIN